MNDLPLPARLHEAPSAHAPALDHLSLLSVTGADTKTFLDSQLTRNVQVDARTASPAGYCSPKGRLLATFVMWAEDDGVRLLVARDIAEPIAKRLRMYVLRAKATVTDVTATVVVEGYVEPAGAPGAAPWDVRRIDAATWIRFPDGDGRRRFLRIGATAGDAAEARVSASTWRWLDIRAGLATVAAATQDRFVPQMLNLEALGGVDFKKGCYPGQEIVARSQYLGKLKRRMALASLEAAAAVPRPGVDIHATTQSEPVGVVVDAERGTDGRVALLAELPVALFASDALRVGSADGPALTVEPPPYALPDNEVFVRPKL